MSSDTTPTLAEVLDICRTNSKTSYAGLGTLTLARVLSMREDVAASRATARDLFDLAIYDGMVAGLDELVQAFAFGVYGESVTLTTPIPDTTFYRAMRSGHRNRTGHERMAR
jgi:hypothetical protein